MNKYGFVHSDIRPGNIMLRNNKPILIDPFPTQESTLEKDTHQLASILIMMKFGPGCVFKIQPYLHNIHSIVKIQERREEKEREVSG